MIGLAELVHEATGLNYEQTSHHGPNRLTGITIALILIEGIGRNSKVLAFERGWLNCTWIDRKGVTYG